MTITVFHKLYRYKRILHSDISNLIGSMLENFLKIDTIYWKIIGKIF